MKTPEEIKKGLECCSSLTVSNCRSCNYNADGCGSICIPKLTADALARIEQLEAEKKHLQNKICNQRRQLGLLHVMYEWALGRLQKANLNDRAHFQRWLMERDYDLSTLELPEAPKEG